MLAVLWEPFRERAIIQLGLLHLKLSEYFYGNMGTFNTLHVLVQVSFLNYPQLPIVTQCSPYDRVPTELDLALEKNS
jgi:hypothetical protein